MSSEAREILKPRETPIFFALENTPREPKVHFDPPNLNFPPAKPIPSSFLEAGDVLLSARRALAEIMGRNPDLVFGDAFKSTQYGIGPLSPLIQHQETVHKLTQMTLGLSAFAQEHGV